MTSDLFNLVPLNSTPSEEIEKLSKCDCCFAHNHNKPHKLSLWKELPYNHAFSKPFSNSTHDGYPLCKCDCRHRARFICRKFYIKNDI